MALDYIYYFDKKSPFDRHTLGQPQSDFNMGLTIDGAKDSWQVQIYGFIENELVPNTILYHNATNTWWVVRRDIVKRYANEKDYWYTHNLTLVGAIDLLNARDLTDCGFNDDTYTIDQFIKRLFKLSTFEFPITINYGNNIDENKQVDYIKSFENYTLLSALREFLNGYNCDAKLTFEIFNRQLVGAILHIIPRTGNVDLPIVDIDEFDDIRETKTINKESYGTTVVSNAQNVVSTLTKTYPQVGGVGLTADKYAIETMGEGYIKLPTPAYKVNWVKAISPIKLFFIEETSYGINVQYDLTSSFFPQNEYSFDYWFQYVVDNCWTQEQKDWLNNNKEKVRKLALGGSQITFPNDITYNPRTRQIRKMPNVHYIPDLYYNQSPNLATQMVCVDKQTHDTFYNASLHGMYWERGSDKIQGLNTFSAASGDSYYPTRTDLVLYGLSSFWLSFYSQQQGKSFSVAVISNQYLWGDIQPSTWHNLKINHIGLRNTVWQVNYIPMGDLKIKYDNARNEIDSSIYNQNGKLNDSVALSKLVDSHAKEIQSDSITRYMNYTDFADIPQVGTLVDNNGEKYVITNISYDFLHNESISNTSVGYYIECEFTMSKYISTKSLMVNPNSNIRDYGIPQKYNVKRKQTYRDFYEFSLSVDSLANLDTPYVSLDNYIIVGTNVDPKEYDHTAIIKIDYDEEIDNSTSWFYQLSTIAFVMNKSVYEIVDFNDNNIIGYDMQNVQTGFNMSDLWNQTYNNINTPVSYVDDKGKAKAITLQMVGKQNIENLYNEIIKDNNQYNANLLSSHVFVGSEFYYGKYTSNVPVSENKSDLWFSEADGTARVFYQFPRPADYESGSMSVDNFIVQDENDQWLPSAVVNVYQIAETPHYINITLDIDTGLSGYSNGSIIFRLNYTTGTQVYPGAIDIKDYEIKELDYNKDAIEVPVFEYILQLGDTEEVEVGERILDTQSGMLQMYTCDVRQANTTTQLNASKVFSGLSISGDTLVDDNYDRQIEIADTSAVDISFENNNTIMRIKVYDTQTALLYGNADQDFDYQSTQVSVVQKPKSYLLGKDIVIYKNVIKSMSYDTDNDVATCDYDNELMFIIHNPQESNFDGDDLIINVNYYKLK